MADDLNPPPDVLFEQRYLAARGENRFRQVTGKEPYDPAKDRMATIRNAQLELAARNQHLQELKFAKDLAQDGIEQQQRERILQESAGATQAIAGLNAKSEDYPLKLAEVMQQFPYGMRDERVQGFAKLREGEFDTWNKATLARDTLANELAARATAKQQAQADADARAQAELGKPAPELAPNESTRTVYTPLGQRTFVRPEAKQVDKGDAADRARLGSLETLLARQNLDPEIAGPAKAEYMGLRQKLGLVSGPALTPELKSGLTAAHDALEAQLNSAKPDTRADLIKKINPIKAQLGYQTLDANGQPVASPPIAQVSAPATAPAATTRADATGASTDPLLAQARDAIQRGAPKDAVIERLKKQGIDPSGL